MFQVAFNGQVKLVKSLAAVAYIGRQFGANHNDVDQVIDHIEATDAVTYVVNGFQVTQIGA